MLIWVFFTQWILSWNILLNCIFEKSSLGSHDEAKPFSYYNWRLKKIIDSVFKTF